MPGSQREFVILGILKQFSVCRYVLLCHADLQYKNKDTYAYNELFILLLLHEYEPDIHQDT